jgi:hypothetical protein
VINELALVLPSDISLVNLTGTASPEVTVKNGAQISTRDTVDGPALEIIGCAPNEDSVAGFIAALEDIDGVTRVGIAESQQNETQTQGASPTTDSGTGVDECRFDDQTPKFQLVVAFDEVPVPGTATTSPSVPTPVTPGESPQLAQAAQVGG